jgi:HD superfamily phosphodiesterase
VKQIGNFSGGRTDMDYFKARVAKLLVDYFQNDFRRISHALEVLKHSEIIMENAECCDYEILVASALLHDIGIKPSEEILGYNNGKTQEEYGPPIAEKLLDSIGFPQSKTIKVCEIIANHHSPSRHDYIELKILKEADRIVNKQEGK